MENLSGVAPPVDDELAHAQADDSLRNIFYGATHRLILNKQTGEDFDECTCVRLSPNFVMTTDHSLNQPFHANANIALTKNSGDDVKVDGLHQVHMAGPVYAPALETNESVPVYTTPEGKVLSTLGSNDIIFLYTTSAVGDEFLVPFAGTLNDLSEEMLCCCHFGNPLFLEHTEENIDKNRLVQTQCKQGLGVVEAMEPPFWSVGRARVGEPVSAAPIAKMLLREEKDSDQNSIMFDETRVVSSNYNDHGLFCSETFFCRGGSGCAVGLVGSQPKTFSVFRWAEMVGWCLGRVELYERNLCAFVGTPSFVLWYTIVVVRDWGMHLANRFPFSVGRDPDVNEFLEHLRNYVTVNRAVILEYSRVGDEIAKAASTKIYGRESVGHWQSVKQFLGVEEAMVAEVDVNRPKFVEPSIWLNR